MKFKIALTIPSGHNFASLAVEIPGCCSVSAVEYYIRSGERFIKIGNDLINLDHVSRAKVEEVKSEKSS